MFGESFCSLNMYKPTTRTLWCTRNLHGIVWNSLCFRLLLALQRSSQSFVWLIFWKSDGKGKLLVRIFLDKEVESLEDHGCLFSEIHHWEFGRRSKMTDQEETLNLGSFSLTTTVNRGNRGLVLDKLVPDLWLFFSSQFFVLFLTVFSCF